MENINIHGHQINVIKVSNNEPQWALVSKESINFTQKSRVLKLSLQDQDHRSNVDSLFFFLTYQVLKQFTEYLLVWN